MTTTSTPTPRRRTARGAAAVGLSAILALGAVGCAAGGVGQGWGSDSPTATASIGGAGASSAPSSTSALSSPVELTGDEQAGLLHMIEEEKLAHDVYVTLGEAWDIQTFANISDAETNHTAQVRDLLESLGVTDPTVGMAVGEFSDPAFRTLYDELVAEGLGSETAALAVGAQIEELDIVDLDARSAQTDNAAILAVYANLRSGSENHLRAFTRALEARGETYTPLHLDRAGYDAILTSPSGRGGGRG